MARNWAKCFFQILITFVRSLAIAVSISVFALQSILLLLLLVEVVLLLRNRWCDVNYFYFKSETMLIKKKFKEKQRTTTNVSSIISVAVLRVCIVSLRSRAFVVVVIWKTITIKINNALITNCIWLTQHTNTLCGHVIKHKWGKHEQANEYASEWANNRV